MTKIAIVDDNESWCFVLKTALQQQGYEAETFSDPWQFFQQAQAFDLAIVDFCIPARRHQRELDGIALIQKIRQETAHPPLLLLISSYFPEDNVEDLQSICEEADLVLPRPRQIEALLHPIQDVLAQQSSAYSTARSSA